MNPIRILLVDDNDVIRTAVALYLSTFDELELVGTATNGCEAIELTHLLHPDVILMDLMMPVMDGVKATSIIHRQYPQLPILVLTSTIESELVQAIHQAGAVGHVLKNEPAEHMVKAIHQVCTSVARVLKRVPTLIAPDIDLDRRLAPSKYH